MSKLFKKNVRFESSFLYGFRSSLFTSFKLIGENKSILFFYIVPFLLNIIIFSLFIFFLYQFSINLGIFIDGFLSSDTILGRFLKIAIQPILFIFLFFIGGTIIFTIYGFAGNTLCSPFLGKLSQKTQEIVSDQKDDKSFPFRASLSSLGKTFKDVFRKIIVMAIVYLVSMLLLFIPVIGALLYSVIGYFIASFFLGLQFLNYPLERKRYSFMEKLRIAWKFKYSTIGLGVSFLIASSIPIFGFLGINMGVMGGAIVFEEKIKHTLSDLPPLIEHEII